MVSPDTHRDDDGRLGVAHHVVAADDAQHDEDDEEDGADHAQGDGERRPVHRHVPVLTPGGGMQGGRSEST